MIARCMTFVSLLSHFNDTVRVSLLLIVDTLRFNRVRCLPQNCADVLDTDSASIVTDEEQKLLLIVVGVDSSDGAILLQGEGVAP